MSTITLNYSEDTLVATPTGFSKAGKLKTNDKVITTFGQITKVIKVKESTVPAYTKEEDGTIKTESTKQVNIEFDGLHKPRIHVMNKG